MKIKQILFLTCMALLTLSLQSQPKVIAHRGFWDTPGAAQNSVASLIKADSIGCYGSEFDVWLTADNELIVNHNPFYKWHRMESSTCSELASLTLKNGEKMPTLTSYLKEAAKLPGIELVLELKKHRTTERELTAVKRIIEKVNQYGLQERTTYISFSLPAVKEFIRLAPQNPIYYLKGDLTPAQLGSIGCTGLDYSLPTIRKHPQWIKEAHDLGLKVNVWTVNKEKDMEYLINQKVDFITTNQPLLLQTLISSMATTQK